MVRLRHLIPPALLAVIVVSGLLALAVPAAGLVAVAALAAWLICATVFARRVAGQHGSAVPEVIAAYACIHVAYGTGVWVGLVRFAPRWFVDRRGSAPSLPGRPPAT
jgi:hypothetical protein